MNNSEDLELLKDEEGEDVWVKARIIIGATNGRPMVVFYNWEREDAGELYYPHPGDLIIWKDNDKKVSEEE